MLIIRSVEISPATFGGSDVDAGVSDAGVDAGLLVHTAIALSVFSTGNTKRTKMLNTLQRILRP